MKRSRRSGRLLHEARDVSTARPMHMTKRVRDDVPSLRHPAILAYWQKLLGEARQRGVRTAVSVLMTNHVHWCARPSSRQALRETTKYVFAKLAKFVNRLYGRRGPVFVERYWSACCRSVRQAWNTLGYVLRNPVAAGHRLREGEVDGYTCLDEAEVGADRFLRSILGPTARVRRALLVRMTRGPVPYVPWPERVQGRLPGL